MGSKYDDSAVVELTGKIMVIAIIILFLVVLFVFFLHLYAKWFWYRLDDETGVTRRRRRNETSAGDEEEEVSELTLGLDPIVLKSIPIVKFDLKKSELESLECAVCLSEVVAGEKARLLPKCNHGFHVECIDMWFHSHSTCPLCRNPISVSNSISPSPDESNSPLPSSSSSVTVTVTVTGNTETPNFPTNVLFWGNETQVSTLGACLDEDDRRTRQSIQIPSSSSDSGVMGIEEDDSKSPVPARMRSFKRLLSRDRRVNPSNVDLEQGSRSQS